MSQRTGTVPTFESSPLAKDQSNPERPTSDDASVFELETNGDGSIIGDQEGVASAICEILESSDASTWRQEASQQDRTVTYETCANDRLWRVSVKPESSRRTRFSYVISEIAGQRGDVSAASSDDLLDLLPDAVTVTDLDGRIEYANQSAVDLVGASAPGDLVGTSVWDYVRPDQLRSAQSAGRLARHGKTVDYLPYSIVRPDGSAIPVEIVSRKTTFRGKQAILISAHDLTGLHTMEQALQETQQLIYKVFQTAPLGIVVSRIADGCILDINEAFSHISGVERDDIVGHHPSQVGLEFGGSAAEQMRQDVLERRGAPEIELIMHRPDGKRRVLLCSSSRIEVEGEPCMLSMLNDITDRKRAALELEESENRFRTMADGAPVLIWVADTDRQLTFVNRRWLDFTGRALEDEVGSGWIENVHPDDRDRRRRLFATSSQKKQPFTIEYRLHNKAKGYRWVLDRGIPRWLPDGEFVGYIGSCVDITDRKVVEHKLIQSKAQAEEMTILKSAFLTNMTHEIRTPATVILGFTSILRQGVRKDYHRFINLIERSGRRLLLMLDAVLDLAQVEANTLKVEPGRHNVADVVEGVISMLQPLASDKGLTFEFVPPETKPYATVDPAILSRILNNLFDNAIKFTEEGDVTVSIEEGPHEVLITISDTGIGIDERFLPFIFEPFSQESTGLERTHQGSGLGLAVSKRLVELLGGSLNITSTKGVGTTVVVRLAR